MLSPCTILKNHFYEVAQFNVPAPQPFEPKLHMTDADFHSITLNGKLCDGEGGLGLNEFERVMREQVCHPRRGLLYYMLSIRLYDSFADPFMQIYSCRSPDVICADPGVHAAVPDRRHRPHDRKRGGLLPPWWRQAGSHGT